MNYKEEKAYCPKCKRHVFVIAGYYKTHMKDPWTECPNSITPVQKGESRGQ